MDDAPKNVSTDALYAAVGRAISSWTAVEIQLHAIFAVCLGLVVMQGGGGFSYSNPVPRAVLDSVDGFRVKLLMIDAAIRSVLHGRDAAASEILADWAAEQSKVNKLHGNRNKLAHWTVSRIMTDPNDQTGKPVLMPPHYSAPVGPPQYVRETDVNQWEKSFFKAGQRLGSIVERLASHRGLQEAHIKHTAEQIRISLRDDPILLRRLEQHLSTRR